MFPIVPSNITNFQFTGHIRITPLDPEHGTPLHGITIHSITLFSYKNDSNIYFWAVYPITDRFMKVKYDTNVSYSMRASFDLSIDKKAYSYTFIIAEPTEDTKIIRDDTFTIIAKGRLANFPYLGDERDKNSYFDVVYTVKKIENNMRIFSKVEWMMPIELFERWQIIHNDIIKREYGVKKLENIGFC